MAKSTLRDLNQNENVNVDSGDDSTNLHYLSPSDLYFCFFVLLSADAVMWLIIRSVTSPIFYLNFQVKAHYIVMDH